MNGRAFSSRREFDQGEEQQNQRIIREKRRRPLDGAESHPLAADISVRRGEADVPISSINLAEPATQRLLI
ncbi:MAG TPA: hypothetical protein VHL08_08260 [Dongiaceae bacterium]|nr:hypothetical protein [Dongiaceae bacterium]